MAEILRIGNNDADRSLYEQWALADDPGQVLADMADAARNHRVLRIRVSRTANGPVEDLYVNPAECSWWDVVHTTPQRVASY